MSASRSPRLHHSPPSRGFSLIETMLAIAILSFGMLGIAAVQVIAIRSKNFSANMSTASQLARDLAENVVRWSFTDARLNPLKLVTSATDQTVAQHWDMGRTDIVQSSALAEFGETVGDPNATTTGLLAANYQGLVTPTTFHRYWNVYGLDIAGTGTAQGKLVQIIVRWLEPGVGQRQVALSTYVADSAALWLQ
jgi:prepilin-type N-terminal cleavage/methylation domain-containing protein